MTVSLPKEYKEISYVLDGSDDEDDDEEEEKPLPTINKANIIETGWRTRHDWQKDGEEQKPEENSSNQLELLEKKLEEQKWRFKNGEIN